MKNIQSLRLKIISIKIEILIFFCLSILTNIAFSQNKIVIDADKNLAKISPTMWGVFFEDINFAADGGLYAELVKNRSFEFPFSMVGWKETKNTYQKGKILIINKVGENANNPRYARVTIPSAEGEYSLTNEGFRGMGFQKDHKYDFSISAKTSQINDLKLHIDLVSASGKLLGTNTITGFTTQWKKYNSSIQSSDTSSKGKLIIRFEGKGNIDLDMISLFPQDTWKGRPGGMRKDLVQLIADLKPGFVRFPGGCIVEGIDLTNRYQWKKTIGKVENRKTIVNRWNNEFRHRYTPDYYQSFGLGFYEYFLLSEDLNAEPLPIINCGMACQFNSAEVVNMSELQPYIQDALDLIEFANAPVSTKWGKIRADLDHPLPFNLKYIGVGNEQWESQYFERYKVFEKAILAKYPNMNIVSGSGPFSDGDFFDQAWKELKGLKPALIDEHYYKLPSWFLNNAARYDKYSRSGPKIFAGEYAAHSKEDKDAESRNNWESALAEAAFMTGLERNADIVRMASYAPLLAHVEAWQWRPDLIWFDNLNAMGTPNYYVQKLFGANSGTDVVSILKDGQIIAGKDSLYASAVIDKSNNQLIIKIVNTATDSKNYEIIADGINLDQKPAMMEVLSSAKLTDYNHINQLPDIYPKSMTIPIIDNRITIDLTAHSVNLIKLGYSKNQ